MAHFESDRLIVREYNPSDLKGLSQVLLEPKNFQFSQMTCSTLQDVEKEMVQWEQWRQNTPRENFILAAINRETEEFIGKVAYFRRGHQQGVGMVGWIIGHSHWNKGYATEIGNLLVNVAQKEFGQHRVWSTCHSENLASKRVLEKIGMTYEGTMKQHTYRNGVWADTDIFGLVR